jgi:hypothetical protein
MKSRKAANVTINVRPKNARTNGKAYRPRTTLKRRPNKRKTNKPAVDNPKDKRLFI